MLGQDVTGPGQDVTVPGQGVTVPGQDVTACDYLPRARHPHLNADFSNTMCLLLKCFFYILNITSFNSMFCQKDAEASQISWEFD